MTGLSVGDPDGLQTVFMPFELPNGEWDFFCFWRSLAVVTFRFFGGFSSVPTRAVFAVAGTDLKSFLLGGGVVIGFVFGSWMVFAFYVLLYDMRDDGVKKKCAKV